MTKQHQQAADQALVMDAPRILRKDMTLLSEMIAKYQGIEGALNAAGQETSAEEMSALLIPIVVARASIGNALEKLGQANAPALPGITPEQSNDAAQVAFDLEDALMAFIDSNNRLPEQVAIRPDLYDAIKAAWPERDSMKLPKGEVAMCRGLDSQADSFAFVG